MRLTLVGLKSIFVGLYLLVDVGYVVLSRAYYESYAKAIQGNGFPKKPNVMLMAVASYLCLALAWWFLVADRISASTPLLTSVFYAFILALAIYGVFNTTLYIMFNQWDMKVVLRDTLWGLSWLSLLTLLYAVAVKNM